MNNKYKQGLWFLGLWCGGILVLLSISLLIRTALN